MAEEMWGCRSDEALGRHLLNLDIGLPIDELKLPIRRTQTGESAYSEHALRALNRRGKTIETQVTLAPLIESGGSITGTIILIKVA